MKFGENYIKIFPGLYAILIYLVGTKDLRVKHMWVSKRECLPNYLWGFFGKVTELIKMSL